MGDVLLFGNAQRGLAVIDPTPQVQNRVERHKLIQKYALED